MYHLVVSFRVPAERREDFIAAALQDARGSLAGEPGTLRFEVVADADDPSLFYLDELYEDKAAKDRHAAGEHFRRFIEAISEYAEGPTRLFTGTRVVDPAAS